MNNPLAASQAVCVADPPGAAVVPIAVSLAALAVSLGDGVALKMDSQPFIEEGGGLAVLKFADPRTIRNILAVACTHRCPLFSRPVWRL